MHPRDLLSLHSDFDCKANYKYDEAVRLPAWWLKVGVQSCTASAASMWHDDQGSAI